MQLPKNALAVADKFTGLSPERKKQLLEHLVHIPDASGKPVIDQIIKNGGKEAEFVQAVFNIQAPTK